MRVITRLNVGGPARQVATLTEASESRGFRTILVSGIEDPEEEDMLAELAERGLRPVRLESLRRDVHLGRDLRALRELRVLLRKICPDIVHTHTAKAGAVGRWAACCEHVPVRVHTFHGHSLRGYFSPLRSRLHLDVERFLAKRSQALVCVSAADAEELEALGVGRPRVIRSGLELERFGSAEALGAGRSSREQWGVPPEAVVVGWAGRLTPVKRVDRLLDVVEQLATDPRASSIWTVVAGVGPERARLEDYLSRRPEAHLRFVGRARDMAAFWAGTDVALLTSDREGLPLAMIEAQASGRPAVATGVGGVGEIVIDGVTGRLVDREDVEGLGGAIRALASDERQRERMGEEARRRALAEFSAERLIRETFTLYEELLREEAMR